MIKDGMLFKDKTVGQGLETYFDRRGKWPNHIIFSKNDLAPLADIPSPLRVWKIRGGLLKGEFILSDDEPSVAEEVIRA